MTHLSRWSLMELRKIDGPSSIQYIISAYTPLLRLYKDSSFLPLPGPEAVAMRIPLCNMYSTHPITGGAAHFRFRSKRGQYERKPFHLEPKNVLSETGAPHPIIDVGLLSNRFFKGFFQSQLF